jgi:transcriptional regulator with XRE-family HTH domain
MSTFAKRLKKLRLEKNLLQKELADRINIPRGTIATWENDRRTPELSDVEKIASFFCVSIDYLLGHSDQRNPSQPDPDIIAFMRAAEGLTENEKKEILAYIEFRKAQRRKEKEEEQ